MNLLEFIASLSPLPFVDLNKPKEPSDGMTIELSDTCRKNYKSGKFCEAHYQAMASGSKDGSLVQCPYGFASVKFTATNLSFALTGFVPYPRLGGSKEPIVAKRHSQVKVASERVKKVGLRLLEVIHRYLDMEKETKQRLLELENLTIKNQSMGLHEIRKLNRSIKHAAERLCKKDCPEDPDKAQKELVTIFKSSELMSREFDVIEILSDATQTKLPHNIVSDLYRIFDMCVKIYREVAGGRKILLRAPNNYSPRVPACDKTFHIIPSVFIENALKYSLPGSEIRITIEPADEPQRCVVTVVNESEGQQILDNRIFERGYRANSLKDGSGIGLYVAQLVAEQHNTEIKVESIPLTATRVKHTFTVAFRTTTDKYIRKS